MTVQVEPDQATLEEFMGRVIGYLTGAAAVYGILLGDELGLYRGLVEAGPMSADALAAKVGCNPRLIREWLDGQAAAKLVRYDAVTDSYNMSPEAAMALSDDSSPVFVARGMNGFATFFLDFDKLVAAYRSNGALPWAEHHPRLFAGTEWFFRTGYRAHLTTAWLPALEGIEAKLQGGARVADIGCGHGASVIVMADSYPRSEVWGFDFHQPSIDTARERAAAAHLSDRAHFEVATAKSYPGAYDLI
jgi:hypothetical protein